MCRAPLGIILNSLWYPRTSHFLSSCSWVQSGIRLGQLVLQVVHPVPIMLQPGLLLVQPGLERCSLQLPLRFEFHESFEANFHFVVSSRLKMCCSISLFQGLMYVVQFFVKPWFGSTLFCINCRGLERSNEGFTKCPGLCSFLVYFVPTLDMIGVQGLLFGCFLFHWVVYGA